MSHPPAPLTDSRLAALCAEEARRARDEYESRFDEITRRARERFLARDWPGTRKDATERLRLYSEVLDGLTSRVKELMGCRLHERKLWSATKAVYSSFIARSIRWEVGESFFNSLTRRVFATEGVDQAIEFVVSGTANLLRGVALLDSGVGYAVGDGGTILKSTDAGATWSALASGTSSTLYDVHFFDDSTGVAVGDGGLILRTTDGGASWGAVTSGVRDALRAVSFSGANGICSGGSLDILYSSDSGATWTVAQKNLFSTGFFGAHMLSPTVGFVTGQNAIFQGIFGSTVDGGAHWSFETFYFDGNEGNADDVFFFDGATGVTSGVLFDGNGAIARTTDTGSTWNSSLFPQGLLGIDFPKPDAGFTVGFFGTIMKSTDLGLNWSAQESGTTFDLLDVRFASDGLTGLAVGANGTILRTSNGGAGGDGLALLAAASRKGRFEVELPLTGAPGVECRDGGARGNYHVRLTFNNQLTAVDGAATSCGTLGGVEINPEDASQVLVSLTGVDCNAEDVTVTLTGVQDNAAGVLPSVEVTMTLLLGDVTGDGVLDSNDVEQTRQALKERTDESNFRADVNADGRIDAVDFRIVKEQVAASR